MESHAPDLPHIIVYGTESRLLTLLAGRVQRLAHIQVEEGYGPAVTAKARLDALWMTPMAALELGVTQPPFAIGVAHVASMPERQQQRGLPRYAVVGVATEPGQRLGIEETARVVMRALFEAVQHFNERSKDPIGRIGILPEDLGIRAETIEAVVNELESFAT